MLVDRFWYLCTEPGKLFPPVPGLILQIWGWHQWTLSRGGQSAPTLRRGLTVANSWSPLSLCRASVARLSSCLCGEYKRKAFLKVSLGSAQSNFETSDWILLFLTLVSPQCPCSNFQIPAALYCSTLFTFSRFRSPVELLLLHQSYWWKVPDFKWLNYGRLLLWRISRKSNWSFCLVLPREGVLWSLHETNASSG